MIPAINRLTSTRMTANFHHCLASRADCGVSAADNGRETTLAPLTAETGSVSNVLKDAFAGIDVFVGEESVFSTIAANGAGSAD